MYEIDSLKNAVRAYDFHPSYDNFIEVTKYVTRDMVRGGKNKDNCDYIINNDTVHLALVSRGFKPICWLYSNTQDLVTPEIVDKLGLKMIRFYKFEDVPGFGDSSGHWVTNFVIWKSDEQYNQAIKLAQYLISYEYDPKTRNQYNQFVGQSLGYSQEDIDYFISRT